MRFVATPLLVFALSACGEDSAPQRAAPPPLVTVARPEQRDVTRYIELSGRTDAIAMTEVRARVEGFLEEMHFDPGAIVEKDDILFVIEKADYIAQRDRAAADLKSAEAGVERAKSDLARMEEAYKTNAVSGVQVTHAKAEVLDAEAGILSAQAALQSAELKLSYTDVKAPIAGLVSRNLVDIGNFVGPNNNAVLTTVVQREPIYAYFEIPEKHVNEALRVNAERQEGNRAQTVVNISLPDAAEYGHSGLVDWVDNVVDSSTGTLGARAVFDNEEGLLYPGVFVRVRILGGVIPEAVLVEEAALAIDMGGRFLFVVGEGDVVERRYVTLGQLEGTWRVVESGIEPDERYIVDGGIRARPGLPVRPQERDTEASDGSKGE